MVLIFDEVKTGLTIAPGGAVERFGVQPDMLTLAKALGGGLPTGAIGMTAELATAVEDGSVHHVGTYNGNPLGMAAARANLLEILTPAAYEHLERLGERMTAGCDAVIARHGLPAYTVGLGSKGCVTYASDRVLDYRVVQAPPRPRARRADLALVDEPRPVRHARPRAGVEPDGGARRGRGGSLRGGVRRAGGGAAAG